MSDQIFPSETSAEAPSRAPARRTGLSPIGLGLAAATADVVTVLGTSVFASALYQQWIGHDVGVLDPEIGIGVLASVIYAGSAWLAGLHRPRSLGQPARAVPLVLSLWIATCLSITAILFLLKAGSNYSRGALSLFAGVAPTALILSRYLVSPWMRKLVSSGALATRAVILIGEAEELRALTPADLFRLGFRDAGRVIIGPEDGARTTTGQAIRLGRAADARLFIVVAPWGDAGNLAALQDGLRASPLPVYLLPGHMLRALIERRSWAEGVSVPLIELQRPPMTWVEQTGKRTFDLVVASVALCAVLPLLTAAACAVWIETRGGILFRQWRAGLDQRHFQIYKFRTMTVTEDDKDVVQARRGDQRITRIGRLLRGSSIDELPQLFNVIRGDMSLVGPRPHALAHDHQYQALIARYPLRHHVKPGITGWAQVNGLRGETGQTELMARRVDFDLWYIDNWSFRLDVRILLRTVTEVLRFDAY